MDKTDKLIDWEANERKDRNSNGIDDAIEPPNVDVAASTANLARRLKEDPNADPRVSGGDLDANWEDAQFGQGETALGDSPAPGQSAAEDAGRAIGVTYEDNEVLRVGEKERARDKHRWELDPASSEDYKDRLREEGGQGK